MRSIQIIRHMIDVVEMYIYEMKGVNVRINLLKVLHDGDELDKLIDAFNHAKKQKFNSNPYL